MSHIHLFAFACVFTLGSAFPDGAPCLGNVLESMVPDAKSHGNARTDDPPFEIYVGNDCYWPLTNLNVKLRSTTPGVQFKGFALQARVMSTNEGRGQFERDDNGSWQYQCFKSKYAITHSHSTPKDELSMWWAEQERGSTRYIQFIATVAVDLKTFWVQSVRSKILPPCNIEAKSSIDPKSVKYPKVGVNSRPSLTNDQQFNLDAQAQANQQAFTAKPTTKVTPSPYGPPRDCVHDTWGAWADCSVSCGLGITHRTRYILAQPINGGRACQETKQGQSCFPSVCLPPPVDCQMHPWSNWSPCPSTCGSQGVQRRSRSIKEYEVGLGQKCADLETRQQRFCSQPACIVEYPVDCVMSQWTSWSLCSVTCGSGYSSRGRYVISLQKNNGRPCDSITQETVPCDKDYCPNPVNCNVGQWTAWSFCSRTCGVGLRTRTRDIRRDVRDGGVPCPILEQKQSCYDREAIALCPLMADSLSLPIGSSSRNSFPAPAPAPRVQFTLATPKPQIECVMSGWSAWTTCSSSCGRNGQKQRSRAVVVKSTVNRPCPVTTDQTTCVPPACPTAEEAAAAATLRAETCVDATPNCAGWKNSCNSPGYVKRNCKKSCGTC